jgi:hypothetical protein
VWNDISWAAVALGFTGTWIAGRHHAGWLLGIACAAMWLAYDLARNIPAGAFAALVACGLNFRNWHIGRAKDTTATRGPL